MISDTCLDAVHQMLEYIRTIPRYISSAYIEEDEFIECIARLDALATYFMTSDYPVFRSENQRASWIQSDTQARLGRSRELMTQLYTAAKNGESREGD